MMLGHPHQMWESNFSRLSQILGKCLTVFLPRGHGEIQAIHHIYVTYKPEVSAVGASGFPPCQSKFDINSTLCGRLLSIVGGMMVTC